MKGQKADNRWPAPKEALFLKLYEENHTLDVMAELLGTTKNAVMGKRTRMGLKARKLDDMRRFNRGPTTRLFKPKPKPKPTPKPAEKTMTLVAEMPVVEEPVALIHPEMMKLVPFMEINSSLCRWPLWKDDAEFQDKFFCGNPVAEKFVNSYCACHMRMAFRMSRDSRQNFVPYSKARI